MKDNFEDEHISELYKDIQFGLMHFYNRPPHRAIEVQRVFLKEILEKVDLLNKL